MLKGLKPRGSEDWFQQEAVVSAGQNIIYLEVFVVVVVVFFSALKGRKELQTELKISGPVSFEAFHCILKRNGESFSQLPWF